VTNVWFAAAGVMSLVTCATHITVGGRFIARPLLDARDITAIAKATNYYCWHLVTLAILGMAAAFGWAAWRGAREFAVFATAEAAAFCALNVALFLAFRQGPLKMPQWALFLAVAALGAGPQLTNVLLLFLSC
jgi:hypothetical protein